MNLSVSFVGMGHQVSFCARAESLEMTVVIILEVYVRTNSMR